MAFYLVTAKCGHVGKGKYYEVEFPISAQTKHEAAQLCLLKAKVKKHLKNAISSVIEISFEEFSDYREKIRNNPYIKSHTKREIIEYIKVAKDLNIDKNIKKTSFNSREERILFHLKKLEFMKEEIYA